MSACATCDGFFFKNQKVAVIGGGNTAVEEALYLSNIASHVTLVHRRDKLRSEKILQDHLFEREKAGKVSIVWNHHVDEVLGDDSGVNGVRIAPVAGGPKRDLEVTGMFVAVGHAPNTQLFEGQLEMKGGYLIVKSGIKRQRDADQHPGRVRGRRRRRSCLSPGHHVGRHGLHGGARCRQVPRSGRCRETQGLMGNTLQARIVTSIDRIPAAQWNALALGGNPFVRHEFLLALEQAGCVGKAAGWLPNHLVLEDRRPAARGRAAVPQSHSWGEFVFDWSWARAYDQAGLHYYPKLVSMPPFTPATGPSPLARARRVARRARPAEHGAADVREIGAHVVRASVVRDR